MESEEISTEDLVHLEPRIICDSYIAGFDDLYFNGTLRV